MSNILEITGNLRSQESVSAKKIKVSIDTNILLNVISLSKVRKLLKTEDYNLLFKELYDFKDYARNVKVEMSFFIVDTVMAEFKNHLKVFFEKKEFSTLENTHKIKVFKGIIDKVMSLFSEIKIINGVNWNGFSDAQITNGGFFKQSNFKDIKILYTCIENDIDFIFSEDNFFKTDLSEKVIKIGNFLEKGMPSNGILQCIPYNKDSYDKLNMKLLFGNSTGSTCTNVVKNIFMNYKQFKFIFDVPSFHYKASKKIISPMILDFAESPFAIYSTFNNTVKFSIRANLFFEDKDLVSFLKLVILKYSFSKDGSFALKIAFGDWELINKNGITYAEYLHGLNSYPMHVTSIKQHDENTGLVIAEASGNIYPDFKNDYIAVINSELEELNSNLSKEFKVLDLPSLSIDEFISKHKLL